MSKLNRIDDEFCARHNIARSLLPPFIPGHGNERADILLLSERPRACLGSILSTKHAQQWESGNLKQQLDATGILPSRICFTSLLPHASAGEYQYDDPHWYQQQSALGRERLLDLVTAMPRLSSVVLLGNQVQQAISDVASQLGDYNLLHAFDTDLQHSGGPVQPLSVQYYQYFRNMDLLEQACWGQEPVQARSCASTEVAPGAPVVPLVPA